MIKLFGSIFLICGTSAIGAISVRKLRLRRQVLAEVGRLIGFMRSEITTRLTPVPVLVSILAQESEEPLKSFFKRVENDMKHLGERSFYEIWQNSVENSGLYLKDDEKDVFCSIPRALGRYELEDQRLLLTRAESRFDSFAERADDIYNRDSRTRGFLGFAGGVLISLLLL